MIAVDNDRDRLPPPCPPAISFFGWSDCQQRQLARGYMTVGPAAVENLGKTSHVLIDLGLHMVK